MSRTIRVPWKGKDYLVELIEIDDHGHELETRAATAWKQMRLAAALDGVRLEVRTAYRDRKFQEELRKRYEAYQTYLRDVAAWQTGGGQAGGKPEPKKVDWAALAAKPGSSEHEVGRAVDIERHVADPDLAAAIDTWLNAHAATHGWARDVDSEQWHYAWWAAPLTEAPAGAA